MTQATHAQGEAEFEPPHELHRIGTYSDAIFAIAGTLLILEFSVPHLTDEDRPGELWRAMWHQWPSFVAYLISFETIFVAWAGQHRILAGLTRSSKPFLYANGLLLLSITFIPYPTAVLAEFIDTPQANGAVMFYAAAQVVLNVGFLACWLFTCWPVRLLRPTFDETFVRRTTLQIASGIPLYVITMIVAYWFPVVGLGIIIACHLLWISMTLASID
jgi:uncharacterized membrane protein